MGMLSDGERNALLTIRTLGRLDLTGRAVEPATPLLRQPRRLAVLMYLLTALPRGFHRRESVLATFWPESSSVDAARALRQVLHVLRRHLPPDTIVTRGTQEIGVDRTVVWCDVESFEALLEEGREADALALYDGDFLPGFEIDAAPDFSAWLDAERHRLRRRAVRAAMVLARAREADGDLLGAVDWARAAVARAPYDETVLREALEVLGAANDWGAAAKLFDDARERLRHDLGVPLSTETEQAYRRVRSVPRDAAHASGTMVPAAAPARPRAPAVAPNPDAEVVRLFTQGRALVDKRTPDGVRSAIELFERALHRAPDFARGHAALAQALCILTVYTALPPSDMLARARAHALRALRLDPTLADAHAWLAFVKLGYDWDWVGAERDYQRALELDPHSSTAETYAHYLLAGQRRFDEAFALIERARELNPTALQLTAYAGMIAYYARDAVRTRREAMTLLEVAPEFAHAHFVFGRGCVLSGDLDAAQRAFERAVELTKRSALMLAQLAWVLALRGRATEAVALLDEMAARPAALRATPNLVAVCYAGLGRLDDAMSELRLAYQQRVPSLVLTGVEPGFDPLRAERPFRELLVRIGLRSR